VLDHGRVFVEVPRLMTDDELVAVFEDFIAEVHGRVAERARKRSAKPRLTRPKAALYLRIGTHDTGFILIAWVKTEFRPDRALFSEHGHDGHTVDVRRDLRRRPKVDRQTAISSPLCPMIACADGQL
jgi:hypothetical protein